jgi:hypothetical protein
MSALPTPAPVSPGTRRQSGAAGQSAAWIDPLALMRIKSLQLRAKVVVEGFYSGLHRSPYHGFSASIAPIARATICAISIGGCWPARIATTSSGSKTRPTCAVICWSI